MIKGKHIFFLRVQLLLLAALNTTQPVPGKGFFSHLETRPLLHAELSPPPHTHTRLLSTHMQLLHWVTHASGSHPTCPALFLTQGGQVQLGPFQDEALLLGVGIRSPLQFGVRDAGVLLDLHGGALQQQHRVPKSLFAHPRPRNVCSNSTRSG